MIDGSLCVTWSAAFHGRRLVAQFQRDLAGEHLAVADREARRFRRPGGPTLDELKAAAYEGLCHAAARYDDGKGPFPPYARTWIHRALHRTLEQLGPVFRPEKALAKGRKLMDDARRLEQTLGRHLRHEEKAEAAGIDPATMEAYLGLSAPPWEALENEFLPSSLPEHDAAMRVRQQLQEQFTVYDPEPEEPIKLPIKATGLIAKILKGGSPATIAQKKGECVEWTRTRLMTELRAVLADA